MREAHHGEATTEEPRPALSAAEQIREAEAIRISIRRYFETPPGPDRPAAA
jgi:hypothetical protein